MAEYSTIKFYRGLKERYNSDTHRDGIYFAINTQEIIVNGVSYGSGSDVDLSDYVTLETLNGMLTGYIKSAQYDQETGTLTFLNSSSAPVGEPVVFPKASATVDGLMSKSDKSKLDGIESGAQVNVIESVKADIGEVKLLEKEVTWSLKEAIETLISERVAGVYRYKGTVSTGDQLPSDAEEGDVYNVESEYNGYPSGTNFAWTGSSWDSLGGISTGGGGDVDALTGRVEVLENKFTGNSQTEGSVRNLAYDVAQNEVLIWNEVS